MRTPIYNKLMAKIIARYIASQKIVTYEVQGDLNWKNEDNGIYNINAHASNNSAGHTFFLWT